MTTAAPATAPTTELTVQDPRDGSTVGTLAAATEEEVRAAVETARAAARDWARTAPEERGKALRAAAISA